MIITRFYLPTYPINLQGRKITVSLELTMLIRQLLVVLKILQIKQ